MTFWHVDIPCHRNLFENQALFKNTHRALYSTKGKGGELVSVSSTLQPCVQTVYSLGKIQHTFSLGSVRCHSKSIMRYWGLFY